MKKKNEGLIVLVAILLFLLLGFAIGAAVVKYMPR